MSRKKCGIILGGSGLVGGALLHHFRCNEHEFEIEAPSSKTLDLRSFDDITNYFQRVKPEFIVDAALASIGMNTKSTYEINYLGAMNLARIALAYDIPLIHVSSAAVLKAGSDVGEAELLELKPDLNSYTKSKLMCELTLKNLHKKEGLDYTSVRLGIVYGKHDYTIQGFHRLLFAIAAGTMPVLLCKKGVYHSYTYLKKIPYFIEHILEHRDEFRGQAINFVDRTPVEFSRLILAIRDHLQLKRPGELYMPLPVARFGLKVIDGIESLMAKIGVETRMPPELMFLENLYQTQTLGVRKLEQSSFRDPLPEKSVMSELPEVIEYYMKRWRDLNLISYPDPVNMSGSRQQVDSFENSPDTLINDIHSERLDVLIKFKRCKKS